MFSPNSPSATLELNLRPAAGYLAFVAAMHAVPLAAVAASGAGAVLKGCAAGAVLALLACNGWRLGGRGRPTRLRAGTDAPWSLWIGARRHDGLVPVLSWETRWFTLVKLRGGWRTHWVALDDASGRDAHRRLRVCLRRALG